MLDDASAACILSLIYLVINLVAAAHQLPTPSHKLVENLSSTKSSKDIKITPPLPKVP
jgi:hypothetical protein